MADLFSMTTPLMVRFPGGERRIMVERFPLANGLLYLEPFWTRHDPDEAFRRLEGPVSGTGPWKVGDAVITVLGCQGTDPAMAELHARWQSHIQEPGFQFPPRDIVEALARERGALV